MCALVSITALTSPCPHPPRADPVKTAAGALSLKAYRLTKQAMEMIKERGYFNFDMLKNLKIGHENMFQELKVR